jgi:TetR/AcrR family transcriptional repressor of nem operon
MAATPRRVGAETSKTRDLLLDCVDRLMLDEGYAAVTFRAVAERAKVTPSLVQYYFETIDGIFIAAIRRYSERNMAHLAEALRQHADEPLRVLWEYSWDEATAALTTEFMALGNHRKSIRAVIAEVTERVRKLELDALTARFGKDAPLPDGRVSPSTLLLLITGVPKLLELERGIGVETAHREIVNDFKRYLGSMEPRTKAARRKSAARKPR